MPTRSVGSAKGGGGSRTDRRDWIGNWCFGYQYGARTGTGEGGGAGAGGRKWRQGESWNARSASLYPKGG